MSTPRRTSGRPASSDRLKTAVATVDANERAREPRWAQNVSDTELRRLCRIQNVAVGGSASRAEMVARCDPARITRAKLAATYRWDEQTADACRTADRPDECVARVVKERVDRKIRERCRESRRGGGDSSDGDEASETAWTDEDWDKCLVDLVQTQPGWSADLTDRQLQLYCRASGVDDAHLTRTDRISRCASPFFTAHSKLRKAELAERCRLLTGVPPPDHVTKRYLLRCVALGEANAIVKRWTTAKSAEKTETESSARQTGAKGGEPTPKKPVEVATQNDDEERERGEEEEEEEETSREAADATPDVEPRDVKGWSDGVDDADLRRYCRIAGVPGADAMRRTELIRECAAPFFARAERQSRSTLLARCRSKLAPTATRSELVRCVVDSQLVEWRREREAEYATLKCKVGERRPSTAADTFNDCPPGFRRSSSSASATTVTPTTTAVSCCRPSLKATARRVVNRSRAVHAFADLIRAHVPTRTATELESDLDASSCTPEQKREFLKEQQQADAELGRYLADQKQENPRDYLLVVNLAAAIQDELRKQMESTMQLLERMRKELGEEQVLEREEKEGKATAAETETPRPGLVRRATRRAVDALWWGGSQAVAIGSGVLSAVWSAAKSVARFGLDFVRWTVRDPRTTKIVTFIALEIKRRLCREVSIELGLVKMREEPTPGERVVETAKDAAKKLRLVVSDVIRAFASGPWIGQFLAKVREFTTGCLTKSLTWLVGALGLAAVAAPASAGVATVGAAVASIASAMFAVLMDSIEAATKTALETMAYQDDVTLTVTHVLELLDFSRCLATVTLTPKQLAEHKERSLIGAVRKHGGAAVEAIGEWVTPWVNPWISDANRERLDAFVAAAQTQFRRAVTAQAARNDYLAKIEREQGKEAADQERLRLATTDRIQQVQDEKRVTEAVADAVARVADDAEEEKRAHYREQEGTVREPGWAATDKKWLAEWRARTEDKREAAVADAERATRLEIEQKKLAVVLGPTVRVQSALGRQAEDRVERERRKRERLERRHPLVALPTVELGDRFGTLTNAPAVVRESAQPRSNVGSYVRSFFQ